MGVLGVWAGLEIICLGVGRSAVGVSEGLAEGPRDVGVDGNPCRVDGEAVFGSSLRVGLGEKDGQHSKLKSVPPSVLLLVMYVLFEHRVWLGLVEVRFAGPSC